MGRPIPLPQNEHVSSEVLAAYLDGRLDGQEKAEVQAHLAVCDECREEVTEIAVALRSQARRKAWAVVIPVTAAAGIATILLAGPMGLGSGPGGDQRLRPGPAVEMEAVPRVRVVAPVTGSTVEQSSVVFVWEEVGPTATYRFTLTDEGGDPLWTSETTETAVTLPEDIGLQAGGRYFWFVDALLADGGGATSGIQSLMVRR